MNIEITPKSPLIEAMMSTNIAGEDLPMDPIERALARGAGIFGETDIIKNREASGMLNHELVSGRLAENIADRVGADKQLIRWGFLSSHNGRLIWDYSDPETKKILEKRFGSNEHVGIELLERKGVNPSVLMMVKALGHGGEIPQDVLDFKQTLEFKIAIYADHRTDQNIQSLDVRMADFLVRNFLKEKTEKAKASNILYVKSVIDLAKQSETFNGQMAAEFYGQSGLYNQEGRGNTLANLFQLIIDDARTEKLLEDLGHKPKKWIDEESREMVRKLHEQDPSKYPSEDEYIFIPPTRLERYLRELNMQSIEGTLFDRVYQAKSGDVDILLNTDKTIYAELGSNPYRSWWDNEAKQRVMKINSSQEGNPSKKIGKLLPRETVGADRAVKFFKYVDSLMKNENW